MNDQFANTVRNPRSPNDEPPVDVGATVDLGLGQESDDDEMTFPDVPLLALDEVIAQLTDRAQDVLAAQGRLRMLIRANAAVSGGTDLRSVLHRVAQAARELIEARCTAVGVSGHHGAVEEFVHADAGEEIVTRIGGLPQARRILALLAAEPDPVRLIDFDSHLAALGFPGQNTALGSFLSVPIRVRDHVFGNLLLVDSRAGAFSAEDEQLAIALAATAGAAIDNAQLYQETEQRRQWMAASTEVTQQVFARRAEPPLDLVLRHAVQGATAAVATLVLPMGSDDWSVQAATGVLGNGLPGQVLDIDRTLAGSVIRSGKPVLIDDYRAEGGQPDDLPAGVGPAMSAPLLTADKRVMGALTVARATGQLPFCDADLEQFAGFTAHVSVALALDRARGDRESARTLQEHDRIAADLHDHVIQELFATGMGLAGMVHNLANHEQQARVLGYIEALDATIRRIRTTIFQLQSRRLCPDSLQQRLLAVLNEVTAALHFDPEIDFVGPLDLGVPAELADDVVAVVREALTNIARHAHASATHVRVALVEGQVTVDVTDDGCGIGEPTRRSGLANMLRRAQAHAGSLELTTPPAGGTSLQWHGDVSPPKAA